MRRSRDRLAGLLPEDALQDALEGLGPEEITGPGGLLTQLAGRVIETALGAELTEHLGYPPGQAPPGGAGNHRNGSTRQDGADRARDGRGQDAARPQGHALSRSWSASARRGWPGLDDRVLGLYAGGMSVRDIEAHLQRSLRRRDRPRHDQPRHRRGARGRRRVAHPAAGARLPDRLLRRAAGQGPRGPLGPHPRLLPRVGVTVEGDREVLGIWWQETEGAKFWLAVLNDLHQRGVARRPDRLRRRPDRLPRGDRGRLPRRPGCRPASCIRSAPRCATSTTTTASGRRRPASRLPRRQRRRSRSQELERFDETWGERYPMIAEVLASALGATSRRSWRSPTTCAASSTRPTRSRTCNRQIRKAIKTRGHFPDEQAATKLIYLAIERAETKWRSATAWTAALTRPQDPLRRPTPRLT